MHYGPWTNDHVPLIVLPKSKLTPRLREVGHKENNKKSSLALTSGGVGPRPQKGAFSEPSGPQVGLICSHFRPSRLHIDVIRRHFGPRAGGGTKYINGPTDIFGTPPARGANLAPNWLRLGQIRRHFGLSRLHFARARASKLTLGRGN